MTATRGRLLVANPRLSDPNFLRTVVFMLDHDDRGALGLILNRPSSTPLHDVLEAWASMACEPAVVFVGGPVSPTSALCLARLVGPEPFPGGGLTEGAAQAADQGAEPGPAERLGLLDLTGDVASVADRVTSLRVFAGYAGWGPGQLEEELEAGGWLVLDAAPTDAFSNDPRGLWRRVLRRQRAEVAVLSSFPLDPSTN